MYHQIAGESEMHIVAFSTFFRLWRSLVTPVNNVTDDRFVLAMSAK